MWSCRSVRHAACNSQPIVYAEWMQSRRFALATNWHSQADRLAGRSRMIGVAYIWKLDNQLIINRLRKYLGVRIIKTCPDESFIMNNVSPILAKEWILLIKTAALLALFLVSAVTYGGDIYSKPATSSPSSRAASPAMNTSDKKNKCKKAWKKYKESEACFAPYRLVNGGIKAEAFKHCTEVKQPELCE